MLWQGALCLAIALRAVNFRLTEQTRATYRPLYNLRYVDSVSLRRRNATSVTFQVISRVRFVDGKGFVCNGYGRTPARAHDDAAARSFLRAVTDWTTES